MMSVGFYASKAENGQTMVEEIFDVVDEQDRVIGQAPRSVVHARRLLHRAVHIFVLNPQGEILLQKRSALKDEFPSRYTTSASGHLSAGEDYETAAPRELEEELGITGPLKRLAKFPASRETAYEHTVVYEMTTDQTPRIDAHEIDAATFHSVAEIEEMLARDPEAFSPCFATLFAWYVSHRQ
jgi:16S rRNA (adenine1518-N6/adenine1519-N6)-dimethyltransferase